MIFTVRIFFAGLIAFVPSHDGKQLTVLVPDVTLGAVASDQTAIEPHHALLLARAGSCEGDCGVADPAIAAVLFADQTPGKAAEALAEALQRGAAWKLDGAEIGLPASAGTYTPPLILSSGLRPTVKGLAASRPATASEAKDLSWVADLSAIAPGAAVDPAVLAAAPPAGRLAARLRLAFGEVSTYRLVHIGGRMPLLTFRTLAGKDAAAGQPQALADWVMVEFHVSGSALELTASPFAGGGARSIRLAPDHGLVEIGLLNVAPSHGAMQGHGEAHSQPEPGRHFEMYYELAKGRPLARPVPFVAEQPTSSPREEAPREEKTASPLIAALRLNDPKGVYDRQICALAQLSADADSP